MSVFQLFVRASVIAATVTRTGFDYLWTLTEEQPETASEKARIRGALLSSLLEHLGATFVKFGQILSSRPDLLGPEMLAALSTLQDNVQALEFGEVQRVIENELGEHDLIRSIDPVPLAAASVAQVHRGTLTDGREVVFKVQRPKARGQVERDLSLLRFFAEVANRIPTLSLYSIPGAVQRFGSAMEAQLDFRLEHESNLRFQANFQSSPNVRVPYVVDELSTARVLTMEYIKGARVTEPHLVGREPREVAMLASDTILRMVFLDGFIHADLHPGNVLITATDLVLIDLGLTAVVEPDMQRVWCETFVALSAKDGKRAAELFYVYAPTVGTTDYPRYEHDIEAFFGAEADKPLGEVEVSQIVTGSLEILRRHRIQVDPVFTVVNISVLVAEGVGKQLCPDLDMVQLALPYLMEAMATAPPARLPLRQRPP